MVISRQPIFQQKLEGQPVSGAADGGPQEPPADSDAVSTARRLASGLFLYLFSHSNLHAMLMPKHASGHKTQLACRETHIFYLEKHRYDVGARLMPRARLATSARV